MHIRYALGHPSWIVNRIKQNHFFRTHPDLPWLTRDSVQILSTLLKPEDRGLEWGCGRSTVWFSRHLKHLISVETNAQWHSQVIKMLADANITNVDLRLYQNPAEYVGVVDELKPESLDFALVDGAVARDECAHRVIPILKPGGVLAVDNAEWYLQSETQTPTARKPGDLSRSDAASWDDFAAKVASWRHIWATDGCTCTAFWIKPAR
jgi:predicted O-methyltransferase YrrM